jgi:SAM-dependent methyltransferase
MPDRQKALRKYSAHAGSYTNRFLLRTQESRRRNIARLELTNGGVVIDVGCGTGLSFPILQERIGTSGKIVGIEQSPEMLREAELQVNRLGWRNVVLIQAPAEEAVIQVGGRRGFLYNPRHHANAASFAECSGAPQAGSRGPSRRNDVGAVVGRGN